MRDILRIVIVAVVLTIGLNASQVSGSNESVCRRGSLSLVTDLADELSRLDERLVACVNYLSARISDIDSRVSLLESR